MSKKLIEGYKLLLNNLFSRSKEILGEKFVQKLINKAIKNTTNGGKSLLKGMEYEQNELQLDLVYKNYNENEAHYTREVIADTFNNLIDLADKALSMLVGKENAVKIIKDALKDTKLNNKEIFEGENIEELLSKSII